MAVRVQNVPKKDFGQSSTYSMPHISVNCPPWWNSREQQSPQSLSKNLSLKMGSLPQVSQEAKQLAIQPRDQDSSLSQSTGQSQGQCISSDSVQDESYRKREEGQMKPVLFMSNPSFGITPPQVDHNPSMTHIPYAYADPYFNGLFTAYGPQAMIHPQIVGIPARVPLPLDLSEDGPIYVNAKQYHGILRRRQMRAKLEVQNKLLKNRKPYLHESRHRHALNRVRGSGGRFLPTKKPKKSNHSALSNSHYASDSAHFCQTGAMSAFEVHQSETSKCDTLMTSCSGITPVINGDAIFQQSGRSFSSISSRMGEKWEMRGNGGFLCNDTQNRASIVR